MITYPENQKLTNREIESLEYGVNWIVGRFNIKCPNMHKLLIELAQSRAIKNLENGDATESDMVISDGIYAVASTAMYLALEAEDIHIDSLSKYWVDAWEYADNKFKKAHPQLQAQ